MSAATVARGALAGLAGAAVLGPLDAAEARLLGRPSVYAPAALAGRLGERLLGHRPSERQAIRAGLALRVLYAAGLGAALAVLPGGPLRRCALLAVAVAGAELLGLPALGAAPPVRRWSRAERWLLLPHVAAFAAAAEVARRA